MTNLHAPLRFPRGQAMKNRFVLAPLTNSQSNDDGTLSEDEIHWLVKRAEGGFGLTMSAAAHVQAQGRGFEGQLGIFGDQHLAGLERMAKQIKSFESLAVIQLHHAGMRSPEKLIGQKPVSASDDEATGARALTTLETQQLGEDFIEAAVRAERAGYDGVELHGAHGYVLCQYLSAETNRRDDQYGGSAENRARLLLDIIKGVRERTGPEFQLGVRLSPERFGLDLLEIVALAGQLMREDQLDYIDMSLWDAFKEPTDEQYKGRSLQSYFTELPRGRTQLGAAGKIMSAAQANDRLNAGLDFVVIGRGAILHHNYPELCRDPAFVPIATPVTAAHLKAEGLSDTFVKYMGNWKGFVEG